MARSKTAACSKKPPADLTERATERDRTRKRKDAPGDHQRSNNGSIAARCLGLEVGVDDTTRMENDSGDDGPVGKMLLMGYNSQRGGWCLTVSMTNATQFPLCNNAQLKLFTGSIMSKVSENSDWKENPDVDQVFGLLVAFGFIGGFVKSDIHHTLAPRDLYYDCDTNNNRSGIEDFEAFCNANPDSKERVLSTSDLGNYRNVQPNPIIKIDKDSLVYHILDGTEEHQMAFENMDRQWVCRVVICALPGS